MEPDNLDRYFVWDRKAGSPTYQHHSQHEAEIEASRLAERNKGREFLVLHVVAAAKLREPVEVRRVSDPFDPGF